MPVVAFNHFNLRAPLALTDALRDFYVDVVGLSVGTQTSPRHSPSGFQVQPVASAMVDASSQSSSPAALASGTRVSRCSCNTVITACLPC